MLFNYYGHPVRQERIVAEAYGGIENIPALSGFTIAQQLNRHWVDDNGTTFDAQLSAAFDAQAGVNAINNAIIINALSQDDPLIVGAAGHVTVMTAAAYRPTPVGPYITGIGVFDPWPGRGARQLMPVEFTPAPLGGGLMFLGLATVS
jgi:hypothetical protein